MTTDKNDRNDRPTEGEDTREQDSTAPETPSELNAVQPEQSVAPEQPDTTTTAVPDSPAQLVPEPLWAPADYHDVIDDAAIKLSTSAVAPLVAAARGYRTVDAAGLKNLLVEYSMGPVNGRVGRAFKEAIGYDGALLVPWFSLESVRQAANYHRAPHSCAPSGRRWTTRAAR